MKTVELGPLPPAQNLALDEALVDFADDSGAGEWLRFWESPVPFLVLGHGNRVATEARREVCEKLGVPILRRCSGGGAVLQGPGCLNFALILAIPEHGPLAHITTANRYVMERNRAALERALGRPVAVKGVTDLAFAAESASGNAAPGDGACDDGKSDKASLGNGIPGNGTPEDNITLKGTPDKDTRWLKFSGNAQRRKRRALLFHGSFLLNLDLSLLSEVLAHPTQEPDYRTQRPHTDFVANVPLSADAVKQAIRDCWHPTEGDATTEELAALETRAQQLVAEKYSKPEWNFKF